MRRRTRLIAAVLTTLTATLTVAPTVGVPAAQALAVKEVYVKPATGSYTIAGRGYGHGIGMSQWGAQGAAIKGLTYDRIMAFYYPGTTLSYVANRTQVIRVKLGSLGTAPVPMANTATMRYAVAGSTTFALVNGGTTTPTTAAQLRLVPTATSGVFDLYGRASATAPWTVTRLRGLKTPVVFKDPTANAITLYTAYGTRVYRGAMAVNWKSATTVLTANHVAIEDYVKGVVPREAIPSWRPEALKAQAVAARTFAEYERQTTPTGWTTWDTCDTTACQSYGGRNFELSSTTAAVTATSGRIVNYGGKAALTMFAASNGGYTVSGGLPYLIAKPDPYDGVDTSLSNTHSWKRTVTASAIQAAYPAIGTFTRMEITAREGLGEWGGRVTTVVLYGTKGSVSISGSTFRWNFGLLSSWFKPM